MLPEGQHLLPSREDSEIIIVKTRNEVKWFGENYRLQIVTDIQIAHSFDVKTIGQGGLRLSLEG